MEEVLHLLGQGFASLAHPAILLSCLFGAIMGIIIGIIPGLGPASAIAIMLPAIYGRDPLTAMVMLSCIFYGGTYGGTITAVMINVPGDNSNIMTTLDGHPLAKKGRAGAAIGMGTLCSTIGATMGIIVLPFAAVPLARWGLRLGPPEFFCIYMFAFVSLISMTGKSFWKSLMSLSMGLLLMTIGLDLQSGRMRLTFGSIDMIDGVKLLPAIIGLFGMAEMLYTIVHESDETQKNAQMMSSVKLSLRSMFPRLSELVRCKFVILRSTVIGFFVGVLPGAGGSLASFFAYQTEKGLSKEPDSWGTGIMEGVAAAESANSACFAGSYVPMLALGIPGTGTSAALLSALIILGIQPGPRLFDTNPDVVWGMIASMYVGNIILLVLCTTLIPLFVWLLKMSQKCISMIVLTLCFVGVFSVSRSLHDVRGMLVLSLIGYAFKRYAVPVTPAVLAVVLGGELEISLQQSMTMSMGSLSIFFTRPISLTLMLACAGVLMIPVVRAIRKRKQPVLA
jgi:putative tricarboxylic transport membrane protein